jgi:hypothetical protein
MSAPENVDTRARLLVYARWAAIGLACLAALIIAAFSGAAALRIAAFMAVIAVVLVVLSITLNGAASTKLHLEETLLDEIDMLRDDVRADITTAARATHRALAEKVAHLHENIEHVRRQVDDRALSDGRAAVRLPVSAPPQRRAIAGPPAPAVVHHTETVHVTTHQTYVDPVDDGRAAPFTRPTTRRGEREEYVEPPRVDHGRGDYGAERIRPRDPHAADDAVRHDRAGHDDRGSWSDRAEAGGPVVGRPPAREEPRQRGFGAPRVPDPYEDASERQAWRSDGSARPGDAVARAGAVHHVDEDPADDDRWASMRSGDRWAEVRADERGRELRIGERRTAVRADETGTQMRIVDRWSSVRQDNVRYDDAYESPSHGAHEQSTPFRGGPDNTGETRRERRRREEAEEAGGRPEDDRRSGRRPNSADTDGDRWAAPAPSRPALPASGPESAAGWVRGRGDDDRWDSPRGQREISGEVIRRPVDRVAPPDAAPRRAEHGRSESDRTVPSPRSVEPRSGDRHAADSRLPARDIGAGREGGYGRDAYPDRDAGYGPAGTGRDAAFGSGPASRDVGTGYGATGHDAATGRDAGYGTAGRDGGPGRDTGYPAGRDAGYGGAAPSRDPAYGAAGRGAGSGHDPGYGRDVRDPGPARDAGPVRDAGYARNDAAAGHDARDARGARDDNRWEREPSGGRSQLRPHALDFDVTDDRWR